MANKKITVVGVGVEQPLTAEEEQRIESKIDAMLDPSLPDSPPAEPTVEEQLVPAAPATVHSSEASSEPRAPKVTKIITSFADEETETQTAAAASAPVSSVQALKPKPAAKKPTKIAITQHDEIEAEPVVKTQSVENVAPVRVKIKSEAVQEAKADKVVKKPQVVVANEEPESFDLAAAINASALAAEESLKLKMPIEVIDDSEPVPAVTGLDDDVPGVDNETIEAGSAAQDGADHDAAAGAPPLISKHEASPIGVDTSDVVPTTKIIAPHTVTEITINEPEDAAEDIIVTVEPESTDQPQTEVAVKAISELDDKKYRPPEGPMQFKRAEVPIQPHKPGEPRPPDTTADELSEDEALAKAFETPKTDKKPAKKQKTKHARKIMTLIVLLVLLAAIAAVAALPSLRHKALNLVGLNKTQSIQSANNAPAASVAIATAQTAPIIRDIYVARRDGVYSLYKLGTDNQPQVMLAGTGNEESTLIAAANADNSTVALISTRDGKKNTAGELQESIALVTAADGKVVTADTADKVKLVDWIGSRVVYVISSTSTNTTDTNRYQLISYDVATKSRIVLDHATYLNDVLSAKGSVYYAIAATPSTVGQFASIKPDGTAKQNILAAEVAAITRTGYDTLTLSTINKWYNYQLGSAKATQTNSVSQAKSRLYIDSPDGKYSAYVADSKIIVWDITSAKETVLSANGATYPIHWSGSDTLVYRNGTADYSISAGANSSGPATKLVDVANVAGISLWRE